MRLAFFVPSLSATQLSYQLIKNINAFYQQEKTYGVDIAVFYENITVPIIKPDFALANVVDAWNYDGCLVSTTLSTAYKALRFPRSKNLFYVYDLEWVGLKNKQYELLAEIYQSERFDLISRSDSHSQAISNAWQREKPTVIGNFNIKEFVKLCQR